MEQVKRNSTSDKTNICKEKPINLTVNEKDITTFMCTPRNLEALGVGYLYNQNIIERPEELIYLGACKRLEAINIQLNKKLPKQKLNLKEVLASSCGKSINREKIKNLGKNNSNLSVNIKQLKELAYEMFNSTVIYKKTGGVHCTAITEKDELLYLEEDVGRHNAVDKVIGKAVLNNENFKDKVIFTSGRISSDMILKISNTEIPIVVSRSIPTNLALDIAEESQITVVGRILRKEPLIYTCSNRVKQN